MAPLAPGTDATGVLSSRGRAEAFARLLDGSPAAGAPAALTPLVRLAGSLRAVPGPALPAGVAAGRAAVVSAAHGGGGAAVAVAVGKAAVASLPGWAPLAAGGLATAVGLTGVGAAATRSLPGDPFYGVKRQVERLQVQLAATPAGEGREQLAQAGTRLRELAALLGKPTADPQAVSRLVADWATSTRAGAAALLPRIGEPGVGEELAAYVRAADPQLRRLAAAVPAALAARLAPATAALGTVARALTAAAPAAVPPAAGLVAPPAVAPPVVAPPAVTPPAVASLPTGKPLVPPTGKAGAPPERVPVARPTVPPVAVPTVLPSVLPRTAPAPVRVPTWPPPNVFPELSAATPAPPAVPSPPASALPLP